MMSELTRLRDEAERILTIYTEYKDSDDEEMRRRVHLQVDRFLMQHREEVMLLTVDGLNTEIRKMIERKEPIRKVHLLSRIMIALRHKNRD